MYRHIVTEVLAQMFFAELTKAVVSVVGINDAVQCELQYISLI